MWWTNGVLAHQKENGMRLFDGRPLGLVKTACLVGPLCLCANATQAYGWFTADSINRIQVNEQKMITVVVNNGTNHECGSKTLEIYNSNAPGVQMILAMLLTHQQTGKRMQFLIDSCNGTFARFDRVEDL
jgi:hypothetical protein